MSSKYAFIRSLVFTGLAFAGFGAQAGIVYSSIPDTLPDNVVSYAYAANSIDELYQGVHLAPGGRLLQSITLTMSDWSLYSNYMNSGYTANGYNQALTVDLFSGATGTPYLGSQTITTLVPWRPEASQACIDNPADTGSPKGYGASCSHGIAFNVTFDFSAFNIAVPDDIIFGLTFQTQYHGYDPVTGEVAGTNAPGPYDSLNLGIGATTVGSENEPYAAHVAARIVTSDAVAVPEPSVIALLAIAGAGLLGTSRRRRR